MFNRIELKKKPEPYNLKWNRIEWTLNRLSPTKIAANQIAIKIQTEWSRWFETFQSGLLFYESTLKHRPDPWQLLHMQNWATKWEIADHARWLSYDETFFLWNALNCNALSCGKRSSMAINLIP